MKILLIEDNPGDARLIQEMLKEIPGSPPTTHVVEKPGLAPAFLSTQSVDVVLLDLNLPDSRGLDTFVTMQNQFPHLPIVVLTGISDEEMAVRTVQLGAQDFLVKGTGDSEVLRRALVYAIERKRNEEHIQNLNRVLSALRGINQLITREKDRNLLIQKSCNLMVETRGFRCAWILLFDEQGKFTATALAGEDIQSIREQLAKGNFPPCVSSILAHKDTLAACSRINENWRDCLPANGHYQGIVSRLEYEGMVYGVVVAYVPSEFVNDPDELDLFRDLAGDIAYALATIEREATRLKAQEELRRSEENLRIMFDTLSEGIAVCDLDGKILQVNEAKVRMHGYERKEDLIGHNVDVLHVKTERFRVKSNITKRLAGALPHTVEYTCVNKDGREFPAEVSSAIIHDSSEQAVGFITVSRDVTERKKMQEQLILTDRLASLGELVSGIAHEVNNPLGAVLGLAQLLQAKELPDDAREDIKLLNKEAGRAVRIVKNMLSFAQKHPLEKYPAQINSIVQSVLDIRQYEQKVNNIELKTSLASDLPEIVADAFQLQQVFFNLVINAEYFMLNTHRRGTLTVKTERIDNMIHVVIADDGPGISEEDLSHVFDPFYTTKEVGKGTGLGLSICYGIVTNHGGRIYAKSEPGKGATFIVELPLQTPDSVAIR